MKNYKKISKNRKAELLKMMEYLTTTKSKKYQLMRSSYSEGMIEVVSLHVNGISIGHIRTNNVENTIYYSDGQ
jgi:hypothetical protein